MKPKERFEPTPHAEIFPRRTPPDREPGWEERAKLRERDRKNFPTATNLIISSIIEIIGRIVFGVLALALRIHLLCVQLRECLDLAGRKIFPPRNNNKTGASLL
jgi:hypothetical protein